MTRRFEYSDAKSNKFWEITVTGKTVTVRYGRIGTDGQTQVKTHPTPAAAKAAAAKQVSEKVGKGYEEMKASASSKKPTSSKKEVSSSAAKGAGSREAKAKPSNARSTKPVMGDSDAVSLLGDVYARTKIGQRLFGGIVYFETAG